jgi:pyruvate dehydrogenase E2 component (dihydrolipoamide acetyltransferase)
MTRRNLRELVGNSVNATKTTVETEELPENKTQNNKISKVKISQLARKIAREFGLDFNTIAGTGPGGLIVKADIQKALKAKEVGSAPVHTHREKGTAVESEVIPLRGIRKRIAEHLTISKQNAADVTTVAEADMTKVDAFRAVMPVPYTAFVVKAAAKRCRNFPF